VPLGIQLFEAEDLELEFSGMETFGNNFRIDLEDLETGAIVDVIENPVYAFSANPNNNPNRFTLHFNGATAIDDPVESQSPLVYSINNKIYVNTNDIVLADILVYNINGQLVGRDILHGAQVKSFDFGLSAGIYLITIKSDDAVWTRKVSLK
jgi:hypothetical protein